MLKRIKKIIRTIIGERGVERVYSVKKNYELHSKYDFVLNNKKFENKHSGESCYILGNGPSLKDVDFNLLKDKTVFTVNFINKVENFDKLNIAYHLWIDDAFFNARKEFAYKENDIKKSYSDISEKKPVCFVPYSAYDYIKSNNVDSNLDINYLYNVGGAMPLNYKKKIDLTKEIPVYRTVVQYAIAVAVYMGFSKIYLFGIDSTNIVSVLDTALNKVDGSAKHAYKSDNSRNEFSQLLNSWDMTDIFYDQYLLFRGYKALNEYCLKYNVSLYNCSSTSLVSSIPRKCLTDILELD